MESSRKIKVGEHFICKTDTAMFKNSQGTVNTPAIGVF